MLFPFLIIFQELDRVSVIKKEEDVYYVEGTAGDIYTLRSQPLQCTCEDWCRHFFPCKHILKVCEKEPDKAGE
jgi:hypothetical protein